MTRRLLLAITLLMAFGAALLFLAPRPAVAQDSTFRYSSSSDVSQAQDILRHLGHLKGSHKSGAMDPSTVEALQSFQRDHALRPTGQLDWETMTQLLEHLPETDGDGDGVVDGKDKCPNTPLGAQVDERGCPKDSDHDGVYDGIDNCPDTPAGAKVNAEGCPLDSDHDGVYDGLDRCPDTPRGAKVDEHGCPKDSDGDGVLDGIDDCPGTPRGTKVDSSGCPVKAEAAPPPAYLPESKKPLILEGVTFETNSATLKSESARTLDRVVQSLKDHPEVRLEIGGHTDSTGDKKHNNRLSKDRANSVRDYLVKHGIASDRLETKGYGSSSPIADNKTAEGRAKNRRVELNRLD